MRPPCSAFGERLASAALILMPLILLGACRGSDSRIVDPVPIRVVPPSFALMRMVGPQWLVSGSAARYSALVDRADRGRWSWSSSDPALQLISTIDSDTAVVLARLPGTVILSVSAAATDTARRAITVLPRPTSSTPIEQSPVEASWAFRLMRLRADPTGDYQDSYAPLVELKPRVAGDLWILEATIELPGVSLVKSRCSTNRKLGTGAQLFGLGDGVWLGAPATDDEAVAAPVLHLVVMDSTGATTQVSLTGTVVPYDFALVPTTQYRTMDEAWYCR